MWFVAHWTWSVKFHGGENAHTPSDFHTFTLSNMKHLTFHFKIYQNICLWSLFDYPLIHFTCTSSFCVLLNVLQSKLHEMLSIHAHITAGATVLYYMLWRKGWHLHHNTAISQSWNATLGQMLNMWWAVGDVDLELVCFVLSSQRMCTGVYCDQHTSMTVTCVFLVLCIRACDVVHCRHIYEWLWVLLFELIDRYECTFNNYKPRY